MAKVFDIGEGDDFKPAAAAAAPAPRVFDVQDEAEFQAEFQAEEQPGIVEATARGAAQGVLPWTDEVVGFGRALLSGAPKEYFGSEYRAGRERERDANRRAQAAHPFAYGAGELAGSVVSSFVPGLGIAKGAKTVGAVAKSAAKLGAFSALGYSEKEDIGGQAVDTLAGAAISGGTAGLMTKVLGDAPERVAKRLIGDQTKGATATLRDRVVGKATAKSGGEPDRVADVLKEITGNKGIRRAEGNPEKLVVAIDKALDPVMERIDKAFTGAASSTQGIRVSNVLGKIEEVAVQLEKDPGKRALSRAVRDAANDVLETWGNRTHVTAQEARVLAKDIGDAAFRGSPAVPPTQAKAAAQQVWGGIKDLITENIDEAARAAGGTTGAELRELNRRASTLLNMQAAARYKASRYASPSTRLEEQFSRVMDLDTLAREPKTYIAKKALEHVGGSVVRGVDNRLAELAQAARAGSKRAQIAQRALQLGFSPVVADFLGKWTYEKFGQELSPPGGPAQ